MRCRQSPDRRRARLLVLTLLLLSFLGPWGAERHLGPAPSTRPYYFPDLVVFRPHLAAAILALPITCLAALLFPFSRLLAAIYRLVGGAIAGATLTAGLLWTSRPALHEMIEIWGSSLYLLVLPLAFIAEVLPLRRTPKADHAEVFK